jgi:hypothetical protein
MTVNIHNKMYKPNKERRLFFRLDTYMSHEGVLYCKPHHRELFQPKVVVREHDEPVNTRTQEAVGKRPEEAKEMKRL